MEDQQVELSRILHKFALNGYPPNLVHRTVVKQLDKIIATQTSNIQAGCKSSPLPPPPLDWTCLPFIPGIFQEIQKILSKVGVKVVSKPVHTVSSLLRPPPTHLITVPNTPGMGASGNLTSLVPTCKNLQEAIANPKVDSARGVVYCIRCNTCKGIYLGQCFRPLGVRKNDHASALSKDDAKYAVVKHTKDSDHIIFVEETSIVCHESLEKIRIGIEAYLITVNQQRVLNTVKNFPCMQRWKRLYDTLPVNVI